MFCLSAPELQYIPRNMHTVFALLCFVVVIHWLIFPYPSGLLHWHCGNLTIAPVPAKQPWWIWINTSCEFIMNDCITTTKQSTTKPCAYFLGYTVSSWQPILCHVTRHHITCYASHNTHKITWYYEVYSFIASEKSVISWSYMHGWWRHQIQAFPRCWPFVRGIHQSAVDYPHKGQGRESFMFALICA